MFIIKIYKKRRLDGISLKELIREKTFCEFSDSSLACSVIK